MNNSKKLTVFLFYSFFRHCLHVFAQYTALPMAVRSNSSRYCIIVSISIYTYTLHIMNYAARSSSRLSAPDHETLITVEMMTATHFVRRQTSLAVSLKRIRKRQRTKRPTKINWSDNDSDTLKLTIGQILKYSRPIQQSNNKQYSRFFSPYI